VTRQADFSGDEWAVLTNAVVTAGLGMLVASRSGLVGKLRELLALSRRLTPQAVPVQFKRNELVLALLNDPAVRAVAPFTYLVHGDLPRLIATVSRAHLHVLTNCERAATLLAVKSPWAEADGVKRWLLWIARGVAEASGDRWLGLGRRVSTEEAGMLAQMSAALHVSPIVQVPSAAQLETLLGLTMHEGGGVSGGEGYGCSGGGDR